MSDDAVLANLPPMSDHDSIVWLRAVAESHTKRISEIVEWKHSLLPPVIMDMQKDILGLNKDTAAIRGEVSTLCTTVDKLATMVAAILPVVKRQEEHERDCVEAGRENIRHREGFEERITKRFDRREQAHEDLATKVDGIRAWVIRGIVATLLTLLGGAVSIIWAVIEHGGLALFSHP